MSSPFGENLARLLAVRRLRWVDLADRAGVTPPVVSDWKQAKEKNPRATTLLKIAVAIECEVDDLVAGINPAYDAQRLTRRTIESGRDEPQPQDVAASQPVTGTTDSSSSKTGPSAGARLEVPLVFDSDAKVRMANFIASLTPAAAAALEPELDAWKGRYYSQGQGRERKTEGG